MRSARMYNCVSCHTQIIICNHCDRGNIYCGSICSQEARGKNHRLANRKYQKSRKGRLKNAERQCSYRARQREKIKKVTDQGSLNLSLNGLLLKAKSEEKKRERDPICCDYCGEEVSALLRHGYLRYQIKQKTHDFSFWPLGP